MLAKIFAKIEKFIPKKWRWILNHEGFKRYFVNTGWMFFGQIFNLAISFFVGAWLVRYLGPEKFGVLSYALAFAGLFAFISDLGINSILNRELIKFPEKRDELLGTALGLKITGGLIAFLVTICAIFLLDISPLSRSLIALYSLTFIFQAADVISTFFQAKVEAKKNVRSQIISSSISSILKVVVMLAGLGVTWLMIIYVLDFVWLGIALLTAYYYSDLKIWKWIFSWSIAKKILSDSWLLMLTSAFGIIYMRIDQVMIGNFLGEKEVGLYASATKILEVWYFIPMIICPSLSPAIINAKKNDQNLYLNRLKKLFFLMFFLAVAVCFVVTLLAKPIIYFLFGNAYLEVASVLRIYIWSLLGTFLGVTMGQYLIAENYTKIYFLITIFGAIANVTLNMILIPRIGILGAAIATVFSYIFVVVSLLFFKKTRSDLLKIIF
jgi:O-antigen/teichoic acid export membrane protein